ncbi:MAG: NAD(P)H-dependent oxidoreductase [Candidatus Omnitrophica bacterium]|nr:NAD(P)H-dependent oxidoreductase [Candidatus Omnitrophota bacterium]MCM8770440.1 NAD(P)H-dependent oxidoreductase [Candidatus Omnitrophota bacterium]
MRALVIYYSYSGNTRKVSKILAEYLKQKGEVEITELKAQDESDKFFTQALRAFKKERAEILPLNFDLSQYDLLCLGTPVWAFGPAPAMNTFLDKCFGLAGKQIVLFTTYGSGAGNNRCLNYMQKILARKGAKDFRRFSIQQFKVNNPEFVLSQIREILS